MSGFKVKAIAKAVFDQKRLNEAKDKAAKRVLQRQAFAVYAEAKASLISGGKKNETSKPGEAPRGHQGLLKRQMRYAVSTDNAVIGPERILGKPGLAPATLEHGGTADIPVWKRVRGKRVKTAERRRARIARRPFMGPALKRVTPRLSEAWRGAIRR